MSDPATTVSTIWPIVQTGLAAVGGLAGVFALAKGTFFTVPQQHQGLVSRFGKYTGSPKGPGLHVKIPLIDQVDARVPGDLRSISDEIETKTQDNQFVGIPYSIQYRVTDPERYYYNTDNPAEQVKQNVVPEIRQIVNSRDFQELYEQDNMGAEVIESVREIMEDYGMDLVRIKIDDPRPDRGFIDANNRVKSSLREREAAENEAQADYVVKVKEAEADAKRTRLTGESVKDFRKSIAESYIETRAALIEAGVNPDAADRFMEEAMRLDTLRDIGDKGNLVITALESGSGSGDNVIPQVMAALKASEQNNSSKPEVTGAAAAAAPAPGA